MVTVEITVSPRAGGPPLIHETFEIRADLAGELVAGLESMATGLPGRTHITRSLRADGAAVIEIKLNQPPPSSPTRPTFEELFRRTGNDRSDK